MYEKQLEAMERLFGVMDRLRVECPWDREQTFESLRNNTIEETFELTDAITNGDMDGIRDELGDLLLHIVFYSRMGAEQGRFDIGDVANALCDKLIYRHPHVYGNVEAGFDWGRREDVWEKVQEETAELRQEIGRMDRDRMEEELGDLFFALVNMARLYGIDPENALERCNKKFIRRFEHIEKRADEQGVELTRMPLEEMERYWQEAKQEGL